MSRTGIITTYLSLRFDGKRVYQLEESVLALKLNERYCSPAIRGSILDPQKTPSPVKAHRSKLQWSRRRVVEGIELSQADIIRIGDLDGRRKRLAVARSIEIGADRRWRRQRPRRRPRTQVRHRPSVAA